MNIRYCAQALLCVLLFALVGCDSDQLERGTVPIPADGTNGDAPAWLTQAMSEQQNAAKNKENYKANNPPKHAPKLRADIGDYDRNRLTTGLSASGHPPQPHPARKPEPPVPRRSAEASEHHRRRRPAPGRPARRYRRCRHASAIARNDHAARTIHARCLRRRKRRSQHARRPPPNRRQHIAKRQHRSARTNCRAQFNAALSPPPAKLCPERLWPTRSLTPCCSRRSSSRALNSSITAASASVAANVSNNSATKHSQPPSASIPMSPQTPISSSGRATKFA